MKKAAIAISVFVLIGIFAKGQNVSSSRSYIIALTAEWKGERFDDGRPKVPDAFLKRLKNISMEEAWGSIA